MPETPGSSKTKEKCCEVENIHSCIIEFIAIFSLLSDPGNPFSRVRAFFFSDSILEHINLTY